MNLYIKEIAEERIEILLELLREKADWLIKIEKPMWNPKYLSKEEFLKKYNNCKMFVIQESEEVVGGFVLIENDQSFWNSEENNDAAYYIHKLVIKDGYTGKGYAKDAIEWVKDYSISKSKTYLRLDCYGDREYLKKLYRECGFTLKREIQVDHNLNACLYELLLN
ncbi:GNAT family N-acetyltransferase [Anaeromicropila herbilytica]|uniref:N-acetyltransferase n=1 Tax=Anaeromicropila herbilytica TaxID=2785025 RepID=A0A7R7IBY2_9FIRM|nr:GNAT family N-acetyltransferase [Anaeromicropila herbilytica]BCN29314.1 N-acetyltransferase [Anaeromicropila herbilytica]